MKKPVVKTVSKKLKFDRKKLRPLEPSTKYFQSLVRSIIYQQLSGKAAATILKNFTALFPRRTFPKPEDIETMSDAKLRSAGLSRPKISYIRDLAAKFIDKTINSRKIPGMSDAEIIDHLLRVKGIGEWTTHMFLIFTLNRPDVLPTGDLAIKKGFQIAYKLTGLPSHDEMVVLANPHSGDRTALSLHLWHLADMGKGGSDW